MWLYLALPQVALHINVITIAIIIISYPSQ